MIFACRDGSKWLIDDDEYDDIVSDSDYYDNVPDRRVYIEDRVRGQGSRIEPAFGEYVVTEDRDLTKAETQLNLLNALDDFLAHHSVGELKEFLREEDYLYS